MDESKGFFERYGAAIQTVSTVVGVIIAGLMLWSLRISRHQLESSIEPRLDVVWKSPTVDLGPSIKAETHSISGISISNSIGSLTGLQWDRLWQGMRTNFAMVVIRNAGAVQISDVQLIMRLEADLDGSGTVTNAFYESIAEILSESLAPNNTLAHDFGTESALGRLVSLPRERARSHVTCFVIKYRQSVDMKPKTKLICFEAMRISPNPERVIAVPVPLPAFLSYYPNGSLSPRIIKNGIAKFLEQMDAIPSLDD